MVQNHALRILLITHHKNRGNVHLRRDVGLDPVQRYRGNSVLDFLYRRAQRRFQLGVSLLVLRGHRGGESGELEVMGKRGNQRRARVAGRGRNRGDTSNRGR